MSTAKRAGIRVAVLALLVGITIALAGSAQLALDWVGATFFVLALQAAIMLALFSPNGPSLFSIYWVFIYLFFCIAPWVQYSGGIVFWSGVPIAEQTYLHTNLLIFLCNLIFIASYFVSYRSTIPFGPRHGMYFLARPFATELILLIVSISSLLVVLSLNDWSLIDLFIRGFFERESDTVEQNPMGMILGMLSRLVPLFCFMYAVIVTRCSRIVLLLLLAVVVLVAFPTGVARYLVGFVYIPILLICFPWLRTGIRFPIALLVALVVIFPVLNEFRYFRSFDALSFSMGWRFLEEAHFDSYQNFARAVGTSFVTFGRQLLGVLLFFVPRSVWPSKPVGSGFELSLREEYYFNNISMPLHGEGFVNLGVLGAMLFASSAAIAFGVLDRRFSRQIGLRRIRSYNVAIYCFLCGALMFVLRGDMLSSVAYIASGLASAWVVKKAVRFVNLPIGQPSKSDHCEVPIVDPSR